jgi:hypothetical protein
MSQDSNIKLGNYHQSVYIYFKSSESYIKHIFVFEYGLDDWDSITGRDSFFIFIFFILFIFFCAALRPAQSLIQWVLESLSPGVKQLGHEVYHSPASSAEVKNAWSYTTTPPYIFMVWCLIMYRICLHDMIFS